MFPGPPADYGVRPRGRSAIRQQEPVSTDRFALPESIRFAVIGDFGTGGRYAADVAAQVKAWNPAFIVTVGDNRLGSTSFDSTVGHFYCGYLKDAGNGPYCSGGTSLVNAFFPSLGNHDYSDSGGLAEYLGYFTLPGAGIPSSGTSNNERYYDFVRGPVHFFVIDSQAAVNNGADLAAQQNWLRAQLATSTAPWQLVLMHHPPYSSGTGHGSTPAMQWPYEAWGADAVLAGHDHTYERLQIGGIPYFVDGLGGVSVYGFGTPVTGSVVRYNGDYGAMLVEANAGCINYRFVTRSGMVVDAYTSDRSPLAAGCPVTTCQAGKDVKLNWCSFLPVPGD
jgi:hypothetical protein